MNDNSFQINPTSTTNTNEDPSTDPYCRVKQPREKTLQAYLSKINELLQIKGSETFYIGTEELCDNDDTKMSTFYNNFPNLDGFAKTSKKLLLKEYNVIADKARVVININERLGHNVTPEERRSATVNQLFDWHKNGQLQPAIRSDQYRIKYHQELLRFAALRFDNDFWYELLKPLLPFLFSGRLIEEQTEIVDYQNRTFAALYKQLIFEWAKERFSDYERNAYTRRINEYIDLSMRLRKA